MWPPPLLRERSPTLQVVGVFLMPIVFGGLCGWLLGESDTAYEIVTALGILGGISAGYEHAGWREGLVRGLTGGALFAVTIVVVHEARGVEAVANLPASLGITAVIYVLFGILFGALGGALRARQDAARARVAGG
jgi:hypothetical protein